MSCLHSLCCSRLAALKYRSDGSDSDKLLPLSPSPAGGCCAGPGSHGCATVSMGPPSCPWAAKRKGVVGNCSGSARAVAADAHLSYRLAARETPRAAAATTTTRRSGQRTSEGGWIGLKCVCRRGSTIQGRGQRVGLDAKGVGAWVCNWVPAPLAHERLSSLVMVLLTIRAPMQDTVRI